MDNIMKRYESLNSEMICLIACHFSYKNCLSKMKFTENLS